MTLHTHRPKVSIIVPCYEAQSFACDAVACALTQTYPNIEVIVAPDDGHDYIQLREMFPSPSLKILPPHKLTRTGAGATRNRAIDAATGDFFAMLDADDVIASHYIERLVSVAEIEGVAIAPTSYVQWDSHAPVRTPAITGARLTLPGFGQLLCSMHPMVHRSLEPGFCDGFAQDVVRTAIVIAKANDVAVVKDSCYLLRIRQGSACNAGIDSERVITQAYAHRQEQILAHPTQLGVHMLKREDRADFAQLFAFRAFVSDKFSKSGASCYNTWVAHQEDALWRAFTAH